MKRSFKEICVELRRKDHTLNEIVKITGRKKTTVYFHIKGVPLSSQKREKISENSKRLALGLSSARRGVALRPFKPFQKWTPKRVLLTAHLIFDGRLAKSCEYNNRSLVLVNRVKNLMALVYDFPPKSYQNYLTGVMRISYHNVEMANFFKNKAVELVSHVGALSLDCQKEFLRAFFDDEGSVDFRILKNKRRVRGYQDDKVILETVKKLLANLNIDASLQGRNEVVISGKENLMKFRDEINFSKGVRINPNRTNSLWKKNLEKRKLLNMAIASFKNENCHPRQYSKCA